MSETPYQSAESFRLLASVVRKLRRPRARRHEFLRALCIAPLGAVHADQFERMWGRDLSTGGFSFLSPQFISAPEILVSFVEPSQVMTARVAWQSEIPDCGPQRVRVGCEFGSRVLERGEPPG